jgi:exodeoxyribonuclease V alpha subunit
MATITKERLAELMAELRAKKAASLTPLTPSTSSYQYATGNYENIPKPTLVVEKVGDEIHMELTVHEQVTHQTLTNNLSADYDVYDKYGKPITYNEQQLRFVQLAGNGQSAVLIGAAGTGKTTCQQGTIAALIRNGYAGILQADGHKFLESNTPGIVIVSFTRRAVSNIRRAVSDDMKKNCLTIHALLEYEPVYYEIMDDNTGEMKKTMQFEPTRTAYRPLPATIKTCVIEEASMVSVELFKELKDALPSNCQFIFLGDIQQLPPVFGSAILGYKMLELPVVELTEVYRQALESPIIRLAHRILSGNPIPVTEYAEFKTPDQLTLHPWKKKIDADNALLTIAKFLTNAIEAGLYKPEEDMILMPFNKGCGTIELNKHIAQHMARKRGVPVFEIVAGFTKLYLSVGDKVLVDKEDALVLGIEKNPNYTGATPQPEGLLLDYWGYNSADENGQPIVHHLDKDDAGDIDFLLSQSVAAGSGEDRVRQSSHIIKVRLLDTDREVELTTAGELNALLLSFALTVHKSQGSEFRKVFLMLHQSHNTMLSRELLYTAVTRAREELYVICEPDSMTKGILSQRIKGNTLAEKAEWFKGKIESKNMGNV